MASIKLLSSKDDEGTKNFLATASGEDLQILDKEDLDDDDALFEFVDNIKDTFDISPQARNDKLLLKEVLFNKVNAGELSGRFADKEGEIFDHIVIEFSNDKEYARKATRIILNRLHKPDTTIIKNQGGGKIQEKNITGEKQILWDLHTERNGDIHLHMLVNRYDIDGNKINPQNSFKDKYVREALLDLINEDLNKANLVALDQFTTGITPSTLNTDKPSLATQNVVKDIIRKGGDISDIKLGNDSISDTALSNEVQRLEKEAATLIEQANRKIQEAKEITKAKEAVDNNKILINKLSIKDKAIEQAQEKILELELLKNTYEEKIQVLLNDKEENSILISSIQEQVNELNLKIEGLENDYNNIEEENNSKDIIIKSKDDELLQQRTTNNHLAKALDGHEETIRELKKIADERQLQHNKEIADIKEQLANQSKLIETQNKQIETLSKDNNILINEISRKDKDISILNELYKEVKTRLSATTTRLKNVVSKLANADIKEALKSVVLDNNQFEKSLDAIDKDTNDKAEKIRALRERFNQAKPENEDTQKQANKPDGMKPKK